jgi:acyl-CoA dehydrogenase
VTRNDSDLDDVTHGLAAFIDREVVPLEERYREHLDDQAWIYGPNGGYSAGLQELMRSVRMRSAAAGYYPVLCPADIGGGGRASPCRSRKRARTPGR